MTHIKRPIDIFYNMQRLTPALRRAIITASTHGMVRMRGASGSPVPRKHEMASLFAGETVISTLIRAGVLRDGAGFGTYVLSEGFAQDSMKELLNYEAAYEAWKSDCSIRRKLAAERKAAKEIERTRPNAGL